MTGRNYIDDIGTNIVALVDAWSKIKEHLAQDPIESVSNRGIEDIFDLEDLDSDEQALLEILDRLDDLVDHAVDGEARDALAVLAKRRSRLPQ